MDQQRLAAAQRTVALVGSLFLVTGCAIAVIAFASEWRSAENQTLIHAGGAGGITSGFGALMIAAARASSLSDAINAVAIGLVSWFFVSSAVLLGHGSWWNALLNLGWVLVGIVPIVRLSALQARPRIAVGHRFPIAEMLDVDGNTIPLSGGRGLIHVQFRRFSGCPLCNTHLPTFARRYEELSAAGIAEVVIFHSKAEIVKENNARAVWASRMQFVADPERDLYKAVGAERSGWTYLFRLRLRTLAIGIPQIPGMFRLRRWGTESGVTQRPMDVLLDAASGQVVDFKYGTDPYDQWSVSDVLELARHHTV